MRDRPDPSDLGLFVGEDIEPKAGSFDTAAMARGEPGLPTHFTWRGSQYQIAECIEKWKTTSRCVSGADEQYVRKHFFKIRTTTGETMTLYCSRGPSRGRDKTKGRWVLYALG